ncbi:MAG: hypothetical protein P8Y94_11100 [Acidobacteriota bacterium]
MSVNCIHPDGAVICTGSTPKNDREEPGSTQEDFSVAGRKLNTFVLFGTMLATWIGTGSIFGNAEKTYRVGIAAFILPLGSLFGIWVLSLLAARARSLRQITIQDLLEARYNSVARLCGVIALVIAYTTIVSYQYRAAGAVLNLTLPGLSYGNAVIVAAVFIIAYTALAGMLSLAYIGVIQGVTMIVGIAFTLRAIGGHRAPGRLLDAGRRRFHGAGDHRLGLGRQRSRAKPPDSGPRHRIRGSRSSPARFGSPLTDDDHGHRPLDGRELPAGSGNGGCSRCLPAVHPPRSLRALTGATAAIHRRLPGCRRLRHVDPVG